MDYTDEAYWDIDEDESDGDTESESEYDSSDGYDDYHSDGYGYDSDERYNDLCVDCHRPCFVPESYLGNAPRCYRCR